MTRFLHSILAVLMLSFIAVGTPHQATAQEITVETEAVDISGLENPRETFRTFLYNMRNGREGAAIRALDVAYIPAPARDVRALRLANLMYQIFNRLEHVNYDTIPAIVEGDSYIYHTWVDGQFYFEVVRGSDEGWRFSQGTLQDLDKMWEAVRDLDQVTGRRVTFTDDPDLWMDQNLPAWLTRDDFILRNYQWMTILLLIFVGVVADRFFRAYAHRLVDRMLTRNGVEFEHDHLPVAAKWIGWTVAGVVWVIGIEALNLPDAIVTIVGVAARFVAVAAGVMAALSVTDLIASVFVIKASKTATKFDDILVPLVRKAVKFFIAAIGIVFIADNMQVNITSLLAGLGIGGLAFALAAKDTVENLFGSITILIDRPFQIGDWVKIGDVEGTVESLGLRSTRIRTFYNSLITVPNSNLIKANVDNLGARRYRRISTMINVTYNTPPEKIDAFCEGIRELIRQHPYTWKNNYHVWLNQFGSHSLDILLFCFHETPDWSTELRERHRLFLDIVRLAKRLGVEFAFPTQTLYLERGAGPAKPSETPFAKRADVMAARERARQDVSEMVDGLLRGDNAPFPPPPVVFNLSLDSEEAAFKNRETRGSVESLGSSDGVSSGEGGSGESGGR